MKQTASLYQIFFPSQQYFFHPFQLSFPSYHLAIFFSPFLLPPLESSLPESFKMYTCSLHLWSCLPCWCISSPAPFQQNLLPFLVPVLYLLSLFPLQSSDDFKRCDCWITKKWQGKHPTFFISLRNREFYLPYSFPCLQDRLSKQLVQHIIPSLNSSLVTLLFLLSPLS